MFEMAAKTIKEKRIHGDEKRSIRCYSHALSMQLLSVFSKQNKLGPGARRIDVL